MSSTLVVGTLTSVLSSALSPPFVLPTYTSPFSSGVHTVSLLTSVISTPARPNSASTPVASILPGQSHQSSSVLQISMTTTTVTTTAVSSSLTLSASSTDPPTSTRVLSMSSSTPSAAIVTTFKGNQSTTTIFVQSTTSLTTIPSTIRPSTLTSTTLSSTTTLNTSLTTTSPLSSSPPRSSLGRTDFPLTTLLESTTIFVTSTNSQGQVMTSIPPVVTEVITTTGSGGVATTITQAIVNPTLAPNNRTAANSSFFNNTGAVVGVFVVVGLASASIMMWILFAIRHRQRMRRIEQETAVEAAVAAAGLNRAPLDDDDEDESPTSPNSRHQFPPGMGQRQILLGLGGSGSLPTSARLSATMDGTIKDSLSSHPGYPMEHYENGHQNGYIPARTTSPSPRIERCTDDPGSSRDRKSSYGHTPTYSAGSFEPLLANYFQNKPDQDTSALTTHLPQNTSPHLPGSSLVPNGNSLGRTLEDGSRASSRRQNSSNSSVFRDEEDYARYVLMVRNVPDDQSQHSL